MRKPTLAVGLTLLAVSPMCPLVAETVDATDPARLAQVIQELGYRALLDTDNVGDPLITSSVAGTEFSIFFYRCNDNTNCKVVLFKVGYDLSDGTTAEVINAWNEANLFGRAYLDDENDPWLEMPVNLDGGVSRANFEDSFDWWEVVVSKFQDHIDF